MIDELEMVDYGFQWLPAEGGLFVPFDDGTSIQLWDDDELCEQEIRRLAPADVKGWQAFCGVKQRLRDALRPDGRRRSLDRSSTLPRRAREPPRRRRRSPENAL